MKLVHFCCSRTVAATSLVVLIFLHHYQSCFQSVSFISWMSLSYYFFSFVTHFGNDLSSKSKLVIISEYSQLNHFLVSNQSLTHSLNYQKDHTFFLHTQLLIRKLIKRGHFHFFVLLSRNESLLHHFHSQHH